MQNINVYTYKPVIFVNNVGVCINSQPKVNTAVYISYTEFILLLVILVQT